MTKTASKSPRSGANKQATVNVGLIGLGTVGSGVARLLLESKPTLQQKTGIDIRLTRIATRTPSKTHGLKLPKGLVTTDVEALLNDPDIDIVVECIGGIEPARSFLTRAIEKGKAVVSANKMLFALHGAELCKHALLHDTSIGFEAAVAGGIPIISILRDDLIGNRIDKLMGIVNGTCNYILTRMVREGKPYKDIIGEAVKLGYAETDPTLDVSGLDAAHKLAILASLAFHTAIDFTRIHVEGIQTLRLSDINFARELGYEVKLIALARDNGQGMDLRVHPTLLRKAHPLSAVMDVFNSVFIHGDAVGDQMFYGRGAGQLPTGSAVVADIVDAARGSAKRTFQNLQYFRTAAEQHRYVKIGDVTTQYFISLRVRDMWGVFGCIATVLGQHKISIKSVIQKTHAEDSPGVPIIILTHAAREKMVRRAIQVIDSLPFVLEPSHLLRVEDDEPAR